MKSGNRETLKNYVYKHRDLIVSYYIFQSTNGSCGKVKYFASYEWKLDQKMEKFFHKSNKYTSNLE